RVVAAGRPGRRLRRAAGSAPRPPHPRRGEPHTPPPPAPVSPAYTHPVSDTARGGPGWHDLDSVRGGCRTDRRVAERGMSKIRALVVDDEPMARDRVLSLLQHEEDGGGGGEGGEGTRA